MSSFRQRMIQHLEDEGVDEHAIAKSLAQVIKGETIRQRFEADSDGHLKLVGEDRSSTPRDRAQGALLYDTLRGGDLGLAPRVTEKGEAREELYRRFAPMVDNRIIAIEQVQPVTIADNTTDTTTSEGDNTISDALCAVAANDVVPTSSEATDGDY